jgi:hypothetical protein
MVSSFRRERRIGGVTGSNTESGRDTWDVYGSRYFIGSSFRSHLSILVSPPAPDFADPAPDGFVVEPVADADGLELLYLLHFDGATEVVTGRDVCQRARR